MSANEDLDRILIALAAGEIDTSEAARRIAELNPPATAEAPAPEPSEPEGSAPPGSGQPGAESASAAHGAASDVTQVVIRATGRRVRVVGDPSVATVAVDGPHVVRRIGHTLEVTSERPAAPSLRNVNPIRPPRGWDDVRDAALGKEVVVHVNPRITVDADITGGNLSTAGLPQLGRIRVTGGGAQLTDVRQVNDALIQVGNATVSGKLDTGRSRVQVESGMLSLILDPDASVTIRSHAQLGRVGWPGAPSGQLDEFVAGNGSGQVDIGVVMGYASVRFAAGY